MKYIIVVLCASLIIAGCDDRQNTGTSNNDSVDAQPAISSSPDAVDQNENVQSEQYYQDRFKKIVYGTAQLADVREALTDQDAGSLTNTVHALYSMRWHRGVMHIMQDMWKLDKSRYPELSWNLIEKPPVRLALASTMNRIQTSGTREFVDYLRQHKNETHEFNIAQVAIGLGFQGDPADVEYLKTLASGDNHYVIQSSLTALSLMNNPAAREALIEITVTFKDDPRSQLAIELLEQAYSIQAEIVKPQESKDVQQIK